MDASVDVLVVGAGPTGLLLAGELFRRGVSCRVIDAHPAPLHWDRATIVHPRSLEVFESLGIVAPLLAVGVKQYRARIHSAGGVLGEIDLSLCGSRYTFNIGVSEEVTESILNDYLKQQGGEVVRAAKLVALENSEQAEFAVATIERDGVQERVLAKWVVGCDGVHSMTRTLNGIELEGRDLTEAWAVFDATVPSWSDSYEQIYGYLDEITVILTALPQKRWRVYVRPSSEESDLIADATTTLRRYLPEIAFADVANPTRFKCHSKVASRYRAGRALLAGDAAHVCSPSQGHGMNSGLQDAYNLAWKLALVCQGHAGAALLDSYEAERRPVAKQITASGDAFEEAQALRDPTARRARDEKLRGMFSDPQTRHHESIAEAELDIDYSESPIVMGDKHAALAPGQRLPDTVEVQLQSGEVCLLHELTHRAGHTALVIGGSQAQAAELVELQKRLNDAKNPAVIESIVVLGVQSGEQHGTQGARATLSPVAAEKLGIDGVTLLVIRPDGHVGLRADRDHLNALAAYQTQFVANRT